MLSIASIFGLITCFAQGSVLVSQVCVCVCVCVYVCVSVCVSVCIHIRTYAGMIHVRTDADR